MFGVVFKRHARMSERDEMQWNRHRLLSYRSERTKLIGR